MEILAMHLDRRRPLHTHFLVGFWNTGELDVSGDQNIQKDASLRRSLG
jgi:hypothetical protein